MIKNEINYINSIDVNIDDTTPVMQQYLKIKRENPGTILLYRLGDFYETFFEDAIVISKDLEIVLTGKDAGKVYGRIPLAGIPVKAVDGYLQKLIEKGRKVSICEQLEDPKEVAKGEIVKRGVVRTITAGTIIEGDFLENSVNNYICAIFEEKGKWGLAYADISTGEFKATQGNIGVVLTELARIKPAEVLGPSANQKIQPFQIVPEEVLNLPEEITLVYNCSKIPAKVFEEKFALNNLKSVYPAFNEALEGYNEYKLAYRAASAVLAYVWENMKGALPKFDVIRTYELTDFMQLDTSSRRNLELVESMRDKTKTGTLLWAVDKTQTNMGTRLLRNWICQPLKSVEKISERQAVVETLINNYDARETLTTLLGDLYDIQRLSSKLSNESCSPRDFLNLRNSLAIIPELFDTAASVNINVLDDVLPYKEKISDLYDIILRTIDDEAPLTMKDGGMLRRGVNSELDYFRDLLKKGKEWIEEFEANEREKTGINTLKVDYNKVFGFYIEVTNSNAQKVPDTYIRKQTLANAERYITPELKKHEDDVLSAQVKSVELEKKLFINFRAYCKEYVDIIRELSQAIAKLDCLLAFANIAVEYNYVKPEVNNTLAFDIKNGRHPVVERILPLGTYVSNNLELAANSTDKTQLMILTGPNMAGKSTYMRQNALIVILAQIGSYVPADYAKIGIVDKIFTRVGASDDLSLGRSTFMVEMSETAYILNFATEKSFILIDEIGRGTSTYDGVAIAWSVAEFIAKKIKARCIFATHYHELNVMTNNYPQIKNYRVTVEEQNGEIEFLRKIIPGGASRSYGIQVAKMAGLPQSVVKRSEDLMTRMQRDMAKNLAGKKKSLEEGSAVPQLSLFGAEQE